jgi:hypothetical protein
MITINCYFFPGEKPAAAREFLKISGAKFSRYVGLWLGEPEPVSVDLITTVISGADQRYSYLSDSIELYFAIHSNRPLEARIGADQLYSELLSGLIGSGISKIGIKIAYVSGIYHPSRNVVVRRGQTLL